MNTSMVNSHIGSFLKEVHGFDKITDIYDHEAYMVNGIKIKMYAETTNTDAKYRASIRTFKTAIHVSGSTIAKLKENIDVELKRGKIQL